MSLDLLGLRKVDSVEGEPVYHRIGLQWFLISKTVWRIKAALLGIESFIEIN